MTIPHDPLHRWWVEVSGENPALVDSFRPTLLGFIAFGRDREAKSIGSGFIIAGAPQYALGLTAKHVIVEGVTVVQRPLAGHVESALFVPEQRKRPSISPEKLKVTWMGPQHANMLNIVHVGYNETLDLSCCIAMPQDKHAAPFQPVSIPIDTTVPSVGEVVHMVSLVDMDISEINPPTDISGSGQVIKLTRRVSIRIGVVTGVHAKGFRHYRWPCFTTSIPAEPGMSGGYVYLPRDGKTIAACGIICADSSNEEARVNFQQCGESIIACAWPTLALNVPESFTPAMRMQTLYDFMRTGKMDMAVGGIDHINMVDLGNGEYKIGFR